MAVNLERLKEDVKTVLEVNPEIDLEVDEFIDVTIDCLSIIYHRDGPNEIMNLLGGRDWRKAYRKLTEQADEPESEGESDGSES